MYSVPSRVFAAVFCACLFSWCVPLPSSAAESVLARIRARGVVRCASIVRPGIAVPTADGKHWYGLSVDVCHAVAAAVLGDGKRIAYRPYFGMANAAVTSAADDTADDIVFLSGAELVGGNAAAAAALQLGPVIAHDALALLVPAAGVAHAADLADKTVCVEPGSPGDRALTSYFERHAIALHEHPFQETDEMRQAYGDGKCDALAGPLTTLASVRADPTDGRRADRILPERLADDPIFAATSGDATWSRIVWWTFSALVDAEDANNDATADPAGSISGVPPAVADELGLSRRFAHDAVAAGGNYRQLFERDLGAQSIFALALGDNALWHDGGLIFGLQVR